MALSDLMSNLVKKIPSANQLAPVYAMIVIVVYTWSILRFFWRLPSWIFFSAADEVGIIFAYMVMVNLAESLIILLIPITMSILLPQKWFYDRFVSRSVSLILFGLGYLIYVNQTFRAEADALYPLAMLWRTVGIFACILTLVHVVDRLGVLRRLLETAANQAVIFLYISIPVSAVAVLVVLIRNIL